MNAFCKKYSLGIKIREQKKRIYLKNMHAAVTGTKFTLTTSISSPI